MKGGIFFILLLLVITGCSTNQTDEEKIDYLFRKWGVLKPIDKKVIVFLSRWGCHTCNEETRNFALQKASKKGLYIIIPYTSKKQLNLEYPDSFLRNQNVIIDQSNDAQKIGFLSDKPLIVHFQKGKV